MSNSTGVRFLLDEPLNVDNTLLDVVIVPARESDAERLPTLPQSVR